MRSFHGLDPHRLRSNAVLPPRPHGVGAAVVLLLGGFGASVALGIAVLATHEGRILLLALMGLALSVAFMAAAWLLRTRRGEDVGVLDRR